MLHVQVKSSGAVWGSLGFSVACGEAVYTIEANVQGNGYVGFLELPQSGQNCVLTMTALSEWDFLRFDEIRYAICYHKHCYCAHNQLHSRSFKPDGISPYLHI